MGGRSPGRLLVIGVLVGSSSEAAAQRTLLVESYVGERLADAERLLAPLRERLQRRGAATATAALGAAGYAARGHARGPTLTLGRSGAGAFAALAWSF